jgi:hypothetical protein
MLANTAVKKYVIDCEFIPISGKDINANIKWHGQMFDWNTVQNELSIYIANKLQNIN